MYEYPDSFGDCGKYLTEDDYDCMAEWPSMRGWYNEACDRGYEGTYEEYIAQQKAQCNLIEMKHE